MVAWPVIKLGTLALRTFCEPIANYLKKEAVYHPKIRQYIINFAQVLVLFFNRCLRFESPVIGLHERRVQRRIYDYAAADYVPIQPLDEDKAIGAGVDLLREFFVFTVVGSTVIFKVSEARKEEERRRQEDELLEEEIELRRQEIELLRQENELLRQENELLRRVLRRRQETELHRQELQFIF
ncbi:uncharacterized protein LOC133307193 [Gastrolobium bilobum]|uniref:uncharacterized protein LOC133307193 n=1 Tax=Gastrolobium bilobum TaxID=150636 RepID=UPI002AB30826|nr:uncharacterized protein LOC133307193 [Gastrolobium bilobum]